ncbi:MAG: hypothetical protein ACI9SG_001108 [Maribacter sp.]|jgi:hypothetical protein
MKQFTSLLLSLLLFISFTDDDIPPNHIELSNLISNYNSERETFETVENITTNIQSSGIEQGPYYFKVTTGFNPLISFTRVP